MGVILFKLIAFHAVADLAIQGDFVANFKNRHHPGATGIWPYVLAGHSLFHGILVYYATGALAFGLAETVLHFTIDFLKCEKWFGFHVDQFLHILCKVVYVILLYNHI